jgi:acylpyruvate hydrolase
VKLATFKAPGSDAARAGRVDGDRVIAFADDVGVRDVLAGLAPRDDDHGWPVTEVKLLAPIPAPGAIYAIGLNYAKHVAETGATAPETPIVFVKVRGSVAPPGGPVRCPAVVKRLDYEGELTIVIGARGAIGGDCVADTFCPFGPWVTTADEIPDAGKLRLQTWVNGELRQDSSTSDLIFGCDELVEFIGQTCTLMPGDLILTGTPSGVGMAMDPPQFLSSGDRVRIAIERLGEIEHPVA